MANEIDYVVEGSGFNVVKHGRPSGAWTMDLPQMPVGVHGCLVASDGKHLYTVGGTSEGGHTDLIQVYDIARRGWREPAAVLPWRHRLMVGAYVQGELYVFFDGSYCVYHPDRAEVEGPEELRAMGDYFSAGKALLVGDAIVLLGGIVREKDGGFVPLHRVVAFDLKARTAQRLSPMCLPRAHPEAVAYGDYVYVFGGRTDYTPRKLPDACTDTIERYDLRAGSWDVLDIRMPLPRMVHTAVRIDKFALLFDGQPRNDALQMSSLWVFDLQQAVFVDNNWFSPYATWSGGSALVDGTVYLVGGNQLAYDKPSPETFVMRHVISSRLIAFRPDLPPHVQEGHAIPRHVY